MKVFFLGAYSDKGREGMMASSYAARIKAVSAMVERAGAKLGSVDYLQGPFDVIADAEVNSYETASGLQAVMMASGGWDELLLLPTMDVDKALNVARTVGGYPMPGNE
ncbi:GYD domain-containing protein [Planktomarina sp.]|nr:GYD domain-containing protein [Planktomarina sp.]